MSTPWADMESAVWAYLATQGTYTSLGLHEFHGYAGIALPVEPRAGLFAASDLPAIASEASSLTSRGFLENGIEDVAEVRVTVVFATSGGDRARTAIEASAAAISDIVNGPSCKRSRFNAPSTIAEYTFRPDSITAIRGHGEGTIRFWAWQFTLVLVGNRRFLT